VGRGVVADHEDIGHGADVGDGCQIAVVVVTQLEQVRCYGVGGDDTHDSGVSIGGFDGHVYSQSVGDSRAVFYQYRLAQQGGQWVGYGARHSIGAAAGGGADQQAQGAGGPCGFLRLQAQGCEQRGC